MIYPEIFVILLLTVLNGLLSLSEMAIVSSRRSRLEHLADKGTFGAGKALSLHDEPGRFLSTVQIGITLVGIVVGAYSGAALGAPLGRWFDSFPGVHPHGEAAGIAVTVLGITYLSLILGELVPKRVALSQPERIAALVAEPMRWLSFFAAPAVWFLHISTETVLRVLRLSGIRENTVTEDEVKSLIDEGTEAGVFLPQEREMIRGVLRLADRPVHVIMTPRSDIVWVDVDAGRDSVLLTVTENRFSRLLVCEGGIDRPLGVVHTKNLLPEALRGNEVELKALIAPVVFTPEHTSVLDTLAMFKKEKLHLAIVVNEYGSTEGLVTIADVLKSIAGDLPDHGENSIPMIFRLPDGTWLVDGSAPTDEVESETDIIMGREVQTMASFMLDHLGEMPVPGANFIHGAGRFEIVHMEGNRIDKVLVEIQ